MKAIITKIQVGGQRIVRSLDEACVEYVLMVEPLRAKITFIIKLPNGETRHITIRDEDGQTVAYGDFGGLPSFLDYAKEVSSETDKTGMAE